MFRFLLVVLCVVGGSYYAYVNYTGKISDSVYENTISGDKYDRVLAQGEKTIFWAGYDDPSSRSIQREINNILAKHKLAKIYKHIPYLYSSINISCINGSSKCVERYLFDRCNSDFCIVMANQRKLIRIKNRNLQELERVLLGNKAL